MTQDVWVWAQLADGELHPGTVELVGEATRLAKVTGGRTVVLQIGFGLPDLAKSVGQYGAELMLRADDERLAQFSPGLYAAVFAQALAASVSSPAIILIPGSPDGQGLAPRIAAKLAAAYCADAVTLKAQPDGIQATRNLALGKAQGVWSYAPGRVLVATMKPGSIGQDAPDSRRKAPEVIDIVLPEGLVSQTEIVEIIKADPNTVPLDEADVVVAGGMGFKDQADLDSLWDFARAVGGAVGGSKPVVDSGWLPRERMIGQSSGRRIAPKVFVGVGVSGSTHFVEGMKGSAFTVAVNTNKGAPLMKLADLAVEGNLYEVLPALAEAVRAERDTSEETV